MDKLSRRSFAIGFALTLIVFGLFNLWDYSAAYQQHVENLNHSFGLPESRFPSWGFPFHWRGYNLGELEDGLVLNLAVIIGCGFIVGFLFRYLTVKFKNRKRV